VAPKMSHTKVAVTSTNPEKIGAVQRAFQEFVSAEYADGIHVDGIATESGIPHGQPWGLQHTYEGCATRLFNLRADILDREYDYIVSVENGVVPILTHKCTYAHDVACVIVEDLHTGSRAHEFSQSRPYPLEEVQAMHRRGVPGPAIGKWCAEHYCEATLSCSRADQVQDCTALVLSSIAARSSHLELG
jgi:non-canonical (house-cleaning) NTP pyrophosphatase